MPDRSHKRIKKHRPVNKSTHFSYTSPVSDDVSNMQKTPAFSFSYLQDSHCITLCNTGDQRAFLDTMRTLSHLTWQQIRGTHRHGLGSEKINRTSFVAAIPDWVSDDVTFISLRFSGLKPMVGFQDGRVFQIMWFDRSLNVYYHGN